MISSLDQSDSSLEPSAVPINLSGERINGDIRDSNLFAFNRPANILIGTEALDEFLEMTSDITVQELLNVPYKRLLVADFLRKSISINQAAFFTDSLLDRSRGAVLIHPEQTINREQTIKLSTGVSHILGKPSPDLLSGNYFATFSIDQNISSPSFLLTAERQLGLHTDGAFLNENIEWLLMAKLKENGVSNGKTSLLHLDDWEDRDTFLADDLAAKPFTLSAPNQNDPRRAIWNGAGTIPPVELPLFFDSAHGLSFRFIDQFIHPQNIAEARYISAIDKSLHESKGAFSLDLPPGCILLINNRFWLHGRCPLEADPIFERELLRQRGEFFNYFE
jgi:glutarate dioxygenase